MPEEKMSPSSPQLALVEHQGVAVALSAKEVASIYKKSRQSGIPFDTLEEVYRRGYSAWTPDLKETPTQTAFNRVNSFIAEGAAAAMDSDLINEKRGLWDNIHAKRERIKRGSGERMRKPGSKGAPTDAAIKASQNEEILPFMSDDKTHSYVTPRNDGKFVTTVVSKDNKQPVDRQSHKSEKDAKNYLVSMSKRKNVSQQGPARLPTPSPQPTSNTSTQTTEEADPCWTGYKQVGMKMKKGKKVPNCVPEETQIDEMKMGNPNKLTPPVKKEWREKLRLAHAKMKADKNPPTKMSQADSDDLVKQFLAKGGKITKEERYMGSEKQSNDPNDPASRFVGDARVYMKDTPGQEVNLKHLEGGSKLKTIKRIVKEACSCEDAEAKPESVKSAMVRMNKLKTPEEKAEFLDKYAKSALQKGGFTDGRFEKMTKEEVELEEKWSDAKHKSPSGGLTRAGVMAYRRENPGSKLQTAVTTKPSKLKKGSKAAKRRKSFCARMGGMKKRLTSAKTARDPDSRINKALRKWNC